MYIALDENNCRIDIQHATKEKEYFCPICHSPVIVRDGKLNAKHFAHLNSCCTDNWFYDMSDWHRHMQEFFPIDAREVTVTNGKHIHRADVLINNTVIEFQHSPISTEEYNDRNTFFMSLGYRLAWVFDVNDQFVNDSLDFSSLDNEWLMTWKNPIRVFSAGPMPSDDSRNFSIWLSWKNDVENENCIYKVIWCLEDDYSRPSFKKIIVSEHYAVFDDNFDVNELFYSKSDHLKTKLAEAKQRKIQYNLKYIGKKGLHREYYTCPRRNEFGIQIYSKKGCCYCHHCHTIAHKNRPNKNIWVVYCCYPEVVREHNEIECYEGFECEGIYIYDI